MMKKDFKYKLLTKSPWLKYERNSIYTHIYLRNVCSIMGRNEIKTHKQINISTHRTATDTINRQTERTKINLK